MSLNHLPAAGRSRGRVRCRHAWLAPLLVALAIASPRPAWSQFRSQSQSQSPSSGQPFNDSGIHSGPPPGAVLPKPKPVLAPVPVRPDPWQRLDRGAVLCDTETSLSDHQAAVTARLGGGGAAEPPGCQMVRQMTPVAVLSRHGPARTEVSYTNSGKQIIGWTDAAIPTQRPLGQ